MNKEMSGMICKLRTWKQVDLTAAAPHIKEAAKGEKMNKMIHKGTIVTMLLLGLLFVTAAPGAMAQGRDRRYRDYNSRYDRDRYDRDHDRDYYGRRFEREDTNGKLIKRTAIGGGIGAAAGALIGGGKGALIGAGAGAGVGYIIHRKKVDDQRDRIRDRFRFGRRY